MNILILEDEEYNRRFIKKIILEQSSDLNIFCCSDYSGAIQVCKEHTMDIVILDIELGKDSNLNGLEVGKIIYEMNRNTKFIFLTGYSKYAIDSFSIHPFDYILKPINITKFVHSIHKLFEIIKSEKSMNDNSNKLVLQNKGEVVIIDTQDIVFIETQNRKVVIHSNTKSYLTSRTLLDLKEELGEGFIQTHKSFLVNKGKISEIKLNKDRFYEITFNETNKKAIISRHQLDKVKKLIIV